MPRPPIPQLVRFEPPGPYKTPDVVGFLGLVLAQGELPPRVRLVLPSDIELQIPIDTELLKDLRDRLNEVFPPDDDAEKRAGEDEEKS